MRLIDQVTNILELIETNLIIPLPITSLSLIGPAVVSRHFESHFCDSFWTNRSQICGTMLKFVGYWDFLLGRYPYLRQYVQDSERKA